MVCDIIVSWASASPSKPKHSSKTDRNNRAIHYDLRQNRLLGINVSRYTETVLENVLSGSKSPQVQSKPSYTLWFATKSSPCINVSICTKIGRKIYSAVRKTPRYSQNRAANYGLQLNRLPGISVSRETEILLKTCSEGQKSSQVRSNSCYKLWFPTKSFPRRQRGAVHWNSLRKTPRYSQNRATNYRLRHNRLLGVSVSR